MDKRRLVVLAVCLCTCLAISSMAIAATIPSGEVTYWDDPITHYLANEPVETGFDVFGWNFEARMAVGYIGNLVWAPWSGCAPCEGDRAVDVRMKFQWNEAYLSNRDGDDLGTHLDFHPFVDWGGANHDTSDGDWQGSGAVCSWEQSLEGAFLIQWTMAAAPADAWCIVGQPYGCDCAVWYDADGKEIGTSSNVAPAGDRLKWIVVKQIGHCWMQGEPMYCNYDNPNYSPGLGGPGGR